MNGQDYYRDYLSNRSEYHLGIFDEVVTVASLDNAVNPGVVSGEEVDAVLDLSASLAVGPEVGSLGWEEVGTETLVGVEEDAVDVVVGLGADILHEELNLVDEVAALDSLGGGSLLRALVVRLDAVLNLAWLDLGDVEAGSEGGLGVVGLMEEVVDSSQRKRLVLLVNLGQHNWGGRVLRVEDGLLVGLVIGNLLGQVAGKLAGVDEGHDVGVVLEHKNLLLAGLIEGAGSDFDNRALLDVGELDLESKSVEGGAGGVLELELVGVLVELEDSEHLGDDVEVTAGLLSLLEGGDGAGLVDDVVLGEEGVGPLLQGLHDGHILGLLSRLLAGVGVRSIVDGRAERRVLLGGVENPGTEQVHVQVELSLAVVDSEFGSVDSDDLADSVDDWQVLELLSVDDHGRVVLVRDGGVESWVNDLEGADEELVSLVREGGVDDDTVEVAVVGGSKGSLVQFDVVVLGLSRLGSWSGSSGWGLRGFAGHI